MRKITKIIIHCSATPEGRNVTVKDIDSWHRNRGFDQIGYHHIIYLDGSIHPGRREEVIGAHVAGHNSSSIGICYIGGVDASMKPKDTRTPQQPTALRKLVADLQKKYTGATIQGHYEFAAIACPSFNVKTEL